MKQSNKLTSLSSDSIHLIAVDSYTKEERKARQACYLWMKSENKTKKVGLQSCTSHPRDTVVTGSGWIMNCGP